jgi:MoaA/NifB/PqqE/SkfB family radical SAM enzyme
MWMNELVRIEPTDSYFSLTWMVGIRCNYDCMYCPSDLHDNTSSSLSLDKLKQYWNSIYSKSNHTNLKYKISFTGGEVTINKNFKDFVQWLRTEYGDSIFQILLTTNGSASTLYYQQLYDYVDNISFSFHSEHANESEFFDTIVKLKQTIPTNKFIHVNIMNEHWNQDRIPLYLEILKKHNVSHSVNEIDYSKSTRTNVIFKGRQNLASSEL